MSLQPKPVYSEMIYLKMHGSLRVILEKRLLLYKSGSNQGKWIRRIHDN